MVRVRGFSVKHRLITLFRRILQRSPAEYRQLNPSQRTRVRPFSKLLSFTRSISTKAQAIVIRSFGPGRSYIRVGSKPVPVPKGQLAVYVGQKDGNFERILVPVVYFNNPLFAGLLKESEKEYGFNHTGGITIPCPVSEFELVQTRIEAGHSTRKLGTSKRSTRSLTG